ncbi:4962_t:CDS:2 [Entrophospora sp. SA101]|nr:4962_t:CDS:2 [Entrophospora sp. SA101]
MLHEYIKRFAENQDKNERFLSHASKNFASSDVYGNAIIIRENGDMNDESIKEVGHLLRNGYRAHMSEHNQETSHPLAISFSDMSVWCYECDDYIDSPNLKQIITACYVSKFGELPPNSSGIQILSDDSGATSSS